MIQCILLLILLVQHCLTDTDPGFRFQVTQKGIDYGRAVILPILTDSIKTAQIPDIKQRVDTPLGHVTFQLTGVRILTVDISNTAVSLKAPANVVASITNAVIALHADWRYKEDHWPHISDHGSVDLTAKQISISLDILVDATEAGEPHISTKSCSFNIGSMDVKFHGGASWLYNLFSDSIADSVKDSIKSQVCPLVVDELNNDLNTELSTLDLNSDIDKNCYIDYSLVQAPFVIKDALFVNGKGEIFDKKDPKECPSPKQDLPDTVNDNKMVTLWITEYMLNTAGYAYQQAGFLQYNLTSKDIPAKVPIKMTTNFFKYFVPALYKAYPGRDIVMWFSVTKPVTFDISTAGVSARAEGIITWLVKDNGTYVNAFTLDAQLDLCLYIGVTLGVKSEIFLNIVTLEPHIQLKKSNIGNFTVDSLQSFISLSRSLIVPFINTFLKSGIPLPAFHDIAFNGFEFALKKGYIMIHTDVKYDPSNNSTILQHNTIFGNDTCKFGNTKLSELFGSIIMDW